MQSIWKLWVTTKSEAKAQRVYSQVTERMATTTVLHTIEPYPKINGFVLTFDVALTNTSWSEAVVEVIALGQRFGYRWCIFGDIYESPSASTEKTSIAGIVMAEWHLPKCAKESFPIHVSSSI